MKRFNLTYRDSRNGKVSSTYILARNAKSAMKKFRAWEDEYYYYLPICFIEDGKDEALVSYNH